MLFVEFDIGVCASPKRLHVMAEEGLPEFRREVSVEMYE